MLRQICGMLFCHADSINLLLICSLIIFQSTWIIDIVLSICERVTLGNRSAYILAGGHLLSRREEQEQAFSLIERGRRHCPGLMKQEVQARLMAAWGWDDAL